MTNGLFFTFSLSLPLDGVLSQQLWRKSTTLKKNTDKNAIFGFQILWIESHWSHGNTPNWPPDDHCWLISMINGNLTRFTSDFTDFEPIFGGRKKTRLVVLLLFSEKNHACFIIRVIPHYKINMIFWVRGIENVVCRGSVDFNLKITYTTVWTGKWTTITHLYQVST